MTFHELLKKELDNPSELFKKLLMTELDKGKLLSYKCYYETYLQFIENHPIEDSIVFTCEEYNISKSTVIRARTLMNT